MVYGKLPVFETMNVGCMFEEEIGGVGIGEQSSNKLTKLGLFKGMSQCWFNGA